MKKRFWSRHPWLRRCTYGILALLFAGIIVLLYIAYMYMPSEDRTDTPAYLRWMEQQHLDGYVNAGNFLSLQPHLAVGAGTQPGLEGDGAPYPANEDPKAGHLGP